MNFACLARLIVIVTTEGHLRDQNRVHAMGVVYWSKPTPPILPKDLPTFYSFAADRIGRGQPVDYLEFGVAHGKSMREMVQIFNSPAARFYGFDSFVGLPEKWLMHDVGAFSNRGLFPEINDDRVQFVKGWFQNSVPVFLNSFRKEPGRPTLVHFDADLYSSTLFLLASLWFNFDDYYFLMDDFIHDEVVALRDFTSGFPVKFEFFAQTKGGGERPNPDQVFGHMKRINFELDGEK
jgi:Macrocin-O-methyltransferase (TylF)